MASQIVPAAKRYRISLLLDAYGELLTEKQQTFLHFYFEEDLSFGEIAKEYGVSRQAIFDSVKHGEDALEGFERALHLVENGWARWITQGQSTDALADRLVLVREKFVDNDGTLEKTALLQDLDSLIADLRGNTVEEENV